MGTIKKFASFQIRKLSGGKDPLRIIAEFLSANGFTPEPKEKDNDSVRWMVTLPHDQELEIILENMRKPNEATIYMGVNVAAVILRRTEEMLAAALEIADGLVGIKVSLVGNYLVLSATLPAQSASADDLEYHYKLITAQEHWFRSALQEELSLGELPLK